MTTPCCPGTDGHADTCTTQPTGPTDPPTDGASDNLDLPGDPA